MMGCHHGACDQCEQNNDCRFQDEDHVEDCEGVREYERERINNYLKW